jgi:iron complex outermembrane receptor protein
VIQERANWTYRLDDLTPLYNGASSAALSGALVSLGGGLTERIRSFELGYLQQVPSLGLTVDVKAFDDHLSDLIVDYVSAMRYAKGASTNSSVQLTGVEVQARWALAQGWSGFLNYCNLLNRHATQAIEQAQYARHSGSVGISRDFGEGWQAALAYYGASSDGQLSNPYSRTDLNISKDFKLRDSRVNAGFTLSYLDTLKVNDYAGLPGSFSFSYRQHMAVGARVSVSF